ncbi:glutathione-regulated potassium-efflux system protein KefB [Hydrogenimonas sp.]|nr:glutathione-regulated potassium-efflux system protein KefB [Hydrogenimonas sp.]
MMLAETHYKYQIEAELIPFRDLLLGLFFVTVGMQIDLQAVSENIGWIVLAAVVIMVIKFAVILFFMRFSRAPDAVKTALALSQVGEFSLAVFALASSGGLLDPRSVQIILSAVVLSMVFSVLFSPTYAESRTYSTGSRRWCRFSTRQDSEIIS